mmetsp:Transcript_35603/g.83158  ORF Transcript_35603/g.83158 Transcript_35603/m.83158 type:complete len:403 (-) Transcript_35603:325-1533(-)
MAGDVASSEITSEEPHGSGFEVPSHLVAVQRLGSGAYGEVYLCEDTTNGSQVAVKWIRNFTKDPLCGKRILREIRLLAALRHENLLKLTDLLPVPNPDFDDVYIVMPYLHLDLHRVIYSKMKLSESHTQAFVCQILRGLKYLHSAGVAHRDLKPSNILVNKDCALRIADFGLARGRSNSEEELTDYVVTRWYRAPELMLLPSGYFEAVDLWSVGCIHFELMAREVLFPGKDHLDMLRRIAATLGFSIEHDLHWVPEKETKQVHGMVKTLKLPEEPKASSSLEERLPQASEVCLDLLHKFLDKIPTRRISASDALDHAYLAHLHDPAGETVAPRPFAWDFDHFEPSARALKDRVYAECARLHPEIVVRDKEWLSARGFLPQGTAPVGPPPSRAPRPQAVVTSI